MRTTLDLADDVLTAVREISRAERRSMGDVVSDLARRGLAPIRPARRDGFPIFDVPADAPRITPEMVDDALDEG